MPHEDEPDAGHLSETSFAEPSDHEDEDDVLFNLSKDLRNLNIRGPVGNRIGTKVSSASAQALRRETNPIRFRTSPVQEHAGRVVDM